MVLRKQLTSPSDIISFSKVKVARKRKRQIIKSTHLISTPNVEKLVEEYAEKEAQLKEKERKTALKKKTRQKQET